MARLPSWLDRWSGRVSDWSTILALFGSSAAMGFLGSAWTTLAAQGWAAVAIFGIFGGCVICLASAALLAAWRYFRPLPAQLQSINPSADRRVAKVEIAAVPGGAESPITFEVAVAALERAKDFVLIGRYAKAIHYLSGTEWKWEATTRLIEREKIYPGESYRREILRRPRSGENTITIFGDTLQLGHDEDALFLIRIEVVSATKSFVVTRAISTRVVERTLLTDSLSPHDLDYVGGNLP